MFIASHFAFLSPALHLPHCVSFGVKLHRYVGIEKNEIRWHRKRPTYPPTLARSRSISLLTLFFLCFCFSTGKAMLAINKGLQRSVFFSLLPLRFPLLIFIYILCCVASFSISLSFSFSSLLSFPSSTRYEFNIYLRYRAIILLLKQSNPSLNLLLLLKFLESSLFSLVCFYKIFHDVLFRFVINFFYAIIIS